MSLFDRAYGLAATLYLFLVEQRLGERAGNLVQKAKKAKDKFLKRDGEDNSDSGRPESFYPGGIDPLMWEPQELGARRSHLDYFKKHRAARIDHYVIEVNKLIIRLEKLTAFDRVNMESAKIRDIEQSVVPWVNDQDVPFCPDCGTKFSIRNRRHHCRLCGSIMCKKCMQFLTLALANKLTSASREAVALSHSPSQSPGSSRSSRRGSINSVSSISSILEEKVDERIRCCRHCSVTLLRREQQIDEKENVPEIVKLYEKLRQCMEKVDQKAPDYIKKAESLNAGETTYNLEHTTDTRLELQRLYELIDIFSKKILSLGLKDDPKPHPKTVQLQRMIRYASTLFVQEKLLGLMFLPTKEQYEELKKQRKQELEKKLQLERQSALEAQKLKTEKKWREAGDKPGVTANGNALHSPKPTIRKASGWLTATNVTWDMENSDPLLQQIENIKHFIQQAQQASRFDEICTLEENLRQLQTEYDDQQTQKAIELSRKQAEEEGLQREQIDRLLLQGQQQKKLSQHLRTRSLDFREVHASPQTSTTTTTQRFDRVKEPDLNTAQNKQRLLSKTQSMRTFHQPTNPTNLASLPTYREMPEANREPQRRVGSLNPFEDDKPGNPFVDEDALNPFCDESSRGSSPAKEFNDKGFSNGMNATNPFEGKEAPSNPFEDENLFLKPDEPQNPFEEPDSTNPFDTDDDLKAEEEIEEELLRQQINNIRAYIFDAKQNGRMDEVELLTENLRELQIVLAEQKCKS
uniref:Rabenosyn, RAB effector n=1 Tax=Callorhinchus milii TaxID=7868 RepID=A0A4W3K1K4_CALMI